MVQPSLTCVCIRLRPLHQRTCPLLNSISAWSISSRASISSSSSSGISSFWVPWPAVFRNFSRLVGMVVISYGLVLQKMRTMKPPKEKQETGQGVSGLTWPQIRHPKPRRTHQSHCSILSPTQLIGLSTKLKIWKIPNLQNHQLKMVEDTIKNIPLTMDLASVELIEELHHYTIVFNTFVMFWRRGV